MTSGLGNRTFFSNSLVRPDSIGPIFASFSKLGTILVEWHDFALRNWHLMHQRERNWWFVSFCLERDSLELRSSLGSSICSVVNIFTLINSSKPKRRELSAIFKFFPPNRELTHYIYRDEDLLQQSKREKKIQKNGFHPDLYLYNAVKTFLRCFNLFSKISSSKNY